MKKHLLALAVGAAVLNPGLAHAEGPKFYGKVNVSLEQYEGDLSEWLGGATYADAKATDAQWQLDSNASRLGVKGDVDLDVGDLKGIYKAEFEIAVDDGSAVLKQRNIYAGLEGGFGTLMAGKFDSPTKKAQGDVDQFNDLDGDIKHLMAGESRVSNIVQYSSPKLAESVTVNAAFIPAEGDDLDGDGEPEDGLTDSISASVVFEREALYLAAAMDRDIEDELLTDSTGMSTTIDITRLVGGVNVGGVQLGALYQMAEESEGDGEEDTFLVSGAYKIERIKLKAQYGVTSAEGTTGNDTELTLTALGADYKLGSSSKVYAYLANLEGDDGTDSLEDRTFGIGMEHKF